MMSSEAELQSHPLHSHIPIGGLVHCPHLNPAMCPAEETHEYVVKVKPHNYSDSVLFIFSWETLCNNGHIGLSSHSYLNSQTNLSIVADTLVIIS